MEARHEETAAFEAVGYATFSGHVGVCAASSAPGTVRLLRGLHDARPDGAPVVALLGTDLTRATTDPAGRVGALSDGARTFADGAAGRLPRPGRPVGLRSVPPGCAAHGP
ncbi:Thiamine pyrophosphate enzyme, N-terminal TPP binding domain [Streptomyces sp. TLI_105]|nr:Thiamine pyrophosphate enzyme, N-terminal TPP binding domain [Streptomyces sp. TLI_105]